MWARIYADEIDCNWITIDIDTMTHNQIEDWPFNL